MHLKALRYLNLSGMLALFISLVNVQPKKKGLFSFLGRSKKDDSALEFTKFLCSNNIELSRDNYLPFYVVYAYLTSKRFSDQAHNEHTWEMRFETIFSIMGLI